MAFFEAGLGNKKPKGGSEAAKCGACGLSKHCRTPKMEVWGEGRQGILVVGDFPSIDADGQGLPIAGAARGLLQAVLGRGQYGVDLDVDCWMTNSIICAPYPERKADPKEVDYCRPNLNKLIKSLNPRVIIPLGSSAIRSVLAPLVGKSDPGQIERWVGWQIPSQKLNAWVCPSWGPQYVLDERDTKEGEVIRLWLTKHLERAVGHQGRPWPDGVPDHSKSIKVLLDGQQVADWIREKMELGGAFAFDYETTCLKPHNPGAEIVCSSICWRGRETIAYPWVGAAVDATRDFLVSDHPKIGANCKFEECWSRVHLGVEVRNWKWDCVQSAHHLDCREGITSVKHQAFVRLGVDDWASELKPYLESADDSGLNRVKQFNLRKLLLYCGLDSLHEYLIAVDQKREMGMDL